MKLFYQAEKARCSDIIPFYDERSGRFKPFYLKRWPPRYQGIDAKPGWYMLDTEDLVHYREHDTGIFGATGCVIWHDGKYHMFPCLLTPESQVIRHAVSDDLETWTEIPEDTFGPDGVIYDRNDWRDAFVFFHEGEQKWWMLVCASVKDAPTALKGCVGLCVSDDLSHWEYRLPFYAPGSHQSALECPDLFRIGDWYYLIFSTASSRYQTFYRMSKSINGPWIAPPVDTFDTRVFYAGKTASDGEKRYLFGWAAAKEFNAKGFNPPCWPGKDYGTFDHGGTMVVHEIRQNPNGTLAVVPVETVRNAMSKEVPLEFESLQGQWRMEADGYHVSSPDAYACALMNSLPECYRLEADITFAQAPLEYGIALQVDREFVKGYYLQLEPARQRVQWKTAIRMYEDGGATFPYEVELERPVALQAGAPVHVTILAEGSLIVVYLNGQTAMTVRGFDYMARKLGLYVSEGEAKFEHVSMYTMA
ncbi:MAG: glycoside hydrolase [Clostridia bacterium]|nr:glycoside hydrolase [Clostridia bacterium]